MRNPAPVANPALSATADAADRFRRQLAAFVARRAPMDDVDDIVQTIFERAARHDEALSATENPRAWLFRVARSVLADYYRDKASAAPSDDARVLLADETPPFDAPPDLSPCIAPLLATLPEKYRDAVQAVDMEGRSQVDMAEEMDLGLSAVKSRVQRGRKMLKRQILACCRVDVDGHGNVIDADVKDDGVCGRTPTSE